MEAWSTGGRGSMRRAVVVDDRGREIVGARARRASPARADEAHHSGRARPSRNRRRGGGDARRGGAATSASMPRMNASRGSSSPAIVRFRMEGSGEGGRGCARRVQTRWALSSAWRPARGSRLSPSGSTLTSMHSDGSLGTTNYCCKSSDRLRITSSSGQTVFKIFPMTRQLSTPLSAQENGFASEGTPKAKSSERNTLGRLDPARAPSVRRGTRCSIERCPKSVAHPRTSRRWTLARVSCRRPRPFPRARRPRPMSIFATRPLRS